MPRRHHRRWFAAAAVACGLLLEPAGAAAQVLGASQGATKVAAYHGRVVWSAWDEGASAYRLTTSNGGGAAELLPVGTRTVPFDVDVGPDEHGRPVAVYSRCRREPVYGSLAELTWEPTWARGVGCDVYRYDFAAGRERKVRGASTAERSEFLPSLWRTRLAFAEIDPRRPGDAGLKPRLRLLDLRHPKEKPRAVPGGPAGLYPSGGDRRRNRTAGGPGPTAIDLYGTRVLFTWALIGADCSYDYPRTESDPVTTQLWLARIGRRVTARRIDRACQSERVAFLQSPTLADGRISYIEAGPGISVGLPRRLLTRPLADGRASTLALPLCTIAAVRDSGFLYSSRRLDCGGPSSPWEIARAPLAP